MVKRVRRRTYKQRGSSTIRIDRKRRAKAVGWRIIGKGKARHRYFENRRNRSDRSRKTRL